MNKVIKIVSALLAVLFGGSLLGMSRPVSKAPVASARPMVSARPDVSPAQEKKDREWVEAIKREKEEVTLDDIKKRVEEDDASIEGEKKKMLQEYDLKTLEIIKDNVEEWVEMDEEEFEENKEAQEAAKRRIKTFQKLQKSDRVAIYEKRLKGFEGNFRMIISRLTMAYTMLKAVERAIAIKEKGRSV